MYCQCWDQYGQTKIQEKTVTLNNKEAYFFNSALVEEYLL